MAGFHLVIWLTSRLSTMVSTSARGKADRPHYPEGAKAQEVSGDWPESEAGLGGKFRKLPFWSPCLLLANQAARGSCEGVPCTKSPGVG